MGVCVCMILVVLFGDLLREKEELALCEKDSKAKEARTTCQCILIEWVLLAEVRLGCSLVVSE